MPDCNTTRNAELSFDTASQRRHHQHISCHLCQVAIGSHIVPPPCQTRLDIGVVGDFDVPVIIIPGLSVAQAQALSLVPFVLLVIIAHRRTSLGRDYYGAIGGSRDKALAALLYEAFAAGAGIFLGTGIFSGSFLKNTELCMGIQDHGISIDGWKLRFL